MATYGMTNVTIEKETTGWNLTSYMVYADTERWGTHQIMAQFATEEQAVAWCKENGVVFGNEAWALAENEVEKGCGKIQIGNVMYRNLYIESDRIYGHSNGYWGWRDITEMIKNCKMVKKNIGKTKEGAAGRTVKFGSACTW